MSKNRKRIKVTELELTCAGCPSQWEGRTSKGASVYVRFRWGVLKVDVNGEAVFNEAVSDGMDGCMSYATLKRLTKHIIKWP